MSLTKIAPEDAKRLLDKGATLIDIRGADEHARESIPGARNMPVDAMTKFAAPAPIVFHCRAGARTAANEALLVECVDGEAYILDGGIDAWKRDGLPVKTNAGAPIELMRQVQIGAGSIVALGTALGAFVSPLFYLVPAAMGLGLVFAGISGWCGMAKLLEHAPWNRRPRTPGALNLQRG